MAELKPGMRLKSAVCTTEVIVVKTPGGEVDLTCGGIAMLAATDTADKVAGNADAMGGTALGKRYVNEDESLEILCTKAGEGSLGVGATLLALKEAKPLPASD